MSSAEPQNRQSSSKKDTSRLESQSQAPRYTIESGLAFEPQNVFLFLLAWRLLNALTIQTFFQPDEYFQVLEPAWKLAFGENAGAWITWEWREHLRSAIHPSLFALTYRFASAISTFLKLGNDTTAEVLLAAPKTLQAFFAAVGDFYTWKLARYIYGGKSTNALATLILTVVSPWQWFTSTRSFSNSLETTLTIVALYNWPWHWSLDPSEDGSGSSAEVQQLRVRDDDLPPRQKVDDVTRLRRALLCAALATVLRPTNLLIWASLSYFAFVRGWVRIVLTRTESTTFVRETVICGGIILLLSTIVDRIFYESWVFPPYNFLQVNVVQSLASFYGNNDWHYYISQGYPLLLMTASPFTLIGLSRSLRPAASIQDLRPTARTSLRLISIVSLIVPAAFSNIAHKEVRFIYPLLPGLHTICGQTLASFFRPFLSSSLPAAQRSSPLSKGLLLFLLLAINISISYYTTQIHNSGLINLTIYLRHEFSASYQIPSTHFTPRNMTVGMLMPCHSTPWRSHVQYPPTESAPGIQAWALTCEPPLNLNASAKSTYLDEADLFYADPSIWLKRNMVREPPVVRTKDGKIRTPSSSSQVGFFAEDYRSKRMVNIPKGNLHNDLEISQNHPWYTTRRGRRPWPDYLLFFAQLEPTLQSTLRGSGYLECNRIFNSHWNDDWRRVGDVVVWCLDEGRVGNENKNGDGPSIEHIEDAIHDPPPGAEGADGGQRILAGSRKDKSARSSDSRKSKKTKPTPAPVYRVVENPFWKVREPLPDTDEDDE